MLKGLIICETFQTRTLNVQACEILVVNFCRKVSLRVTEFGSVSQVLLLSFEHTKIFWCHGKLCDVTFQIFVKNNPKYRKNWSLIKYEVQMDWCAIVKNLSNLSRVLNLTNFGWLIASLERRAEAQ